MKKSSILIVAMLLMAASCSQDTIYDLQQDAPIGFRVSLDKQSKATSYTASNLTSFNVTAWKSGGSHTDSAYIDQVDYKKNVDGSFTSDSKYYWPFKDGLDFYAYAPKATAANGIDRISEVSFNVTPLADTDSQVDLIFAKNSGTRNMNSNGVPLNFRHTMSQVRIKVKNSNPVVKFNVTGWKIVGVDGSATFTFDDAVANSNSPAANSANTISATMWTDNDDDYTTSYSRSVSKTVTGTNSTWGLLEGTAILIPQRAPMATGYANSVMNGAYLAIEYEALSAEHEEEVVAAGTWGCWPVGFSWEPGFCYNYTIDLSQFGYEEQGSGELDPIIDDAEIKFVDVTVDLWQAGESGSTSPSEPKYLRFHTEGGTQTLYMVNFMNISSATETDLEYSTDEGATWTTLPMSDGNGSNGVEFGESNNTVTDLLIRGNGFGNRFDSDPSAMVVRSFAFEDPNQLVDCTGSLTSLIDCNDTTCTMTNMGHFIALFAECEALRTAPELPFTELTEYCYTSMFQDCSNLLRAPVLPAATLKTFCYGEMFEGCSSLNYVKALFIDAADDCLNYWLDDVAPTGTFIRNDLATWRKDEAEIPAGWTVKPYDSFLRFHTEGGLQSMTLMDMTNNQTETHLEYSLDGTNWSELLFNAAIEFGDDGTDNVDLYLRGRGFYNSFDMDNGPTKVSVITFSEDYQYVYCSGNVGALSDYDNPTAPLTEDGQFAALFSDCTALITAPDLPATDLTTFCYYNIFANCENLEAAPALPATTLAVGCYYSMFEYCSSLETAPELPATTLEMGCYYSMFNGCTSLETAPELPATTLTMACYYSMFEGCSSLEKAPELPATTLAEMFYYDMFEGCSSLNYVKALFIDVEDDCLDDWLDGVASTGTFIKNDLATWSDDEAEIPAGWTVRPESYTPPSYDPFLRFHTEGGTQTLYMVVAEGDADETNLEYSTNEGATWNTLLLSDDNADNGVVFGEENNIVTDILVRGSGFSNDMTTGTIKAFLFGDEDQLVDCTGNIMCLIDYSDLTCEMTNAGQFAGLFYNCKALRTAPDLPATDLTPACYFGLFIMCSNLSAAPELPATTLAQQCYSTMFAMCSSLTVAPELPATTLAQQCYNSMFGMCSSLTVAPELPATTLVDGCYNEMFEGCSSLNYVKAMFLDVVDDCLEDWLEGVAATGTFIRHDLASWNKAEAGIPDDWTVVDAND